MERGVVKCFFTKWLKINKKLEEICIFWLFFSFAEKMFFFFEKTLDFIEKGC
jgi:hypothetical protein